MKVNIIGIHDVDYMNQKNQRVIGKEIYFSYNHPSVEHGFKTGFDYLSEQILNKFPDAKAMTVGDYVLLDYLPADANGRSRLIEVEILKPASPSQPVERKTGFLK